MGLVRWDPFKDLLFLQERMSRLFDEALSAYRDPGAGRSAGAWSPAVDIYETQKAIILKAEVPGIDISEIDIEVKDNTLILKGQRRFEKSLKEENYHRMERYYGSFQRTFALSSIVDKKGIKANLRDGVLEISIPKLEHGVKKSIKVSVD